MKLKFHAFWASQVINNACHVINDILQKKIEVLLQNTVKKHNKYDPLILKLYPAMRKSIDPQSRVPTSNVLWFGPLTNDDQVTDVGMHPASVTYCDNECALNKE